MTLAYRAEYVKALGKDNVPPVLLPQEWLARHLDELPELVVDDSDPDRWQLLPHCTERTNAPGSLSDWQRVGRRLGVACAWRRAAVAGWPASMATKRRIVQGRKRSIG